MGLFTEYVQEAMRRAEYEIIESNQPYYGHIPGLLGVWAVGDNLKECQEELQSVLEEWILLGLRLGDDIPPLGGLNLNLPKEPLETH